MACSQPRQNHLHDNQTVALSVVAKGVLIRAVSPRPSLAGRLAGYVPMADEPMEPWHGSLWALKRSPLRRSDDTPIAHATWVPDRGDVIWIDHNSQAGRERRDHHPVTVLSTAPFARRVGLVVGCAMTNAPHNRGSSLAVDLGPLPDRPGAHSFVFCQQRKSFDWRARGAHPHPVGRLESEQLEQVLEIVGPMLGLVP